MTSSRGALPSFDSPPVVEVALSVQFEPLERLTTPEVARYWSRMQALYPHWEERAPIATAFEWFGGLRAPRVSIQVGPVDMTDLGVEVPHFGRALFLNEPRTELVQVQRDRFVRNWRKCGNGGAYPRYPAIRAGFRNSLLDFMEFLTERDLGTLVANQCEVTYVNHILPEHGWNDLSEVARVCSTWSSPTAVEGQVPEAVEFVSHSRINDSRGAPLGRLHTDLRPRYSRTDGTPLLALTLTARGRPLGLGVDGVVAWMDLGREHVVLGFEAVTTPSMHSIWGKRHE